MIYITIYLKISYKIIRSYTDLLFRFFNQNCLNNIIDILLFILNRIKIIIESIIMSLLFVNNINIFYVINQN